MVNPKLKSRAPPRGKGIQRVQGSQPKSRSGWPRRSPVGRRPCRPAHTASWRERDRTGPALARLGPEFGVGKLDPERLGGFDDFADVGHLLAPLLMNVPRYTSNKYCNRRVYRSHHELLRRVGRGSLDRPFALWYTVRSARSRSACAIASPPVPRVAGHFSGQRRGSQEKSPAAFASGAIGRRCAARGPMLTSRFDDGRQWLTRG